MNTLTQFSKGLHEIPSGITWYLSDIAEAKGKQELYTMQSPQKLKIVREHALIESSVSSNRIEGVEIDRKRIGTVLFGKPLLKDRNEEEIQGYRDALQLIHDLNTSLKINETTIKKLHKMCRGTVWDAGKYKEKNSDIIERLPSGDVRVRFKTVSAKQTPYAMKQVVSFYHESIKNNEVHPLLIVAACNLDFLCIHPFRDGNGRVSRLLMLLQLYHAGYEAGRYISIERLIEEHKERYYETLKMSSQQWHRGKHDPWPYVNFILYILKKAYTEFADRVKKLRMPKGAKTELVISQIRRIRGDFSLSMLQARCPGVSRDMIRKVLKDLHKERKIEAVGKGAGAKWHKKGNTLK